jgi:5'-deoxynucleotidase YfbR-like HD superfamily hydrolase
MKLQPNEMPNGLLFALRLTEISRWGIVATSRQQSVGEHSYRVCMIAQALYDFVFPVPHNSDDKQLLTSFAMVHDITEVLSGDLDSIFKLAVKAQYPDVFANVINRMAGQRRDAGPLTAAVASLERSVKGTFIEALVKIADYLEALIYLEQYGTNTRHKGNVRDTILENMWARLIQFQRQQSYGINTDHWIRVEKFINMVLDVPGLQGKAERAVASETGDEVVNRVARSQHPSADFGDDPLPSSPRGY